MAAVEKLNFVPSKSVTFMPNGSKQMAELTITNESDKTVMFKMKSTRPGMFKMRPVYGAVAPNEKKLLEGELGKKKLKILFFGINDNEPDSDEEKKEAQEKEKKGIQEGDADVKDKSKAQGEVQKEKIVEVVKKEYIKAPEKKMVFVMYRDQKSLSGEDEDDADAQPVDQGAKTCRPAALGQGPPPATAIPAPPSAAQPPPARPNSREDPGAKTCMPAKLGPGPQNPPPSAAKPAPPPPAADPGAKTCMPAQLGPGPKAPPPPPPPQKGPTAAQQKQMQAKNDQLDAKTCRVNPNFEARPAAAVPNK
ncbi:unnamed protein product [Nippostrongylus brasiliensis]|uniref:Major sperm protein n=1 Tax=Nippostrongylus brasiliensis TaxID=27835 RepID=A0A158QXZ1_NIPBR|nr:unnamed protein product [Nippostrongylus brasiliensis]